jgi:hypothetical protein
MKMTGVSHSLGKGTQTSSRFKSKLAQGCFHELYCGAELYDRERVRLMASLLVDDHSEYWDYRINP